MFLLSETTYTLALINSVIHEMIFSQKKVILSQREREREIKLMKTN